jgi:hypothetical protein
MIVARGPGFHVEQDPTEGNSDRESVDGARQRRIRSNDKTTLSAELLSMKVLRYFPRSSREQCMRKLTKPGEGQF